MLHVNDKKTLFWCDLFIIWLSCDSMCFSKDVHVLFFSLVKVYERGTFSVKMVHKREWVAPRDSAFLLGRGLLAMTPHVHYASEKPAVTASSPTCNYFKG